MINLEVLNNAGHIGFVPSCDACHKPIKSLNEANVLFDTNYRPGPIKDALIVHKHCDKRQLWQWMELDCAVAALQVEVQQ